MWASARAAMETKDHSWAGALIGKLRDSEMLNEKQMADLRKDEAKTYRALADGIANTNGRAWLYQVAYELDHGKPKFKRPTLDDEFLEAMPVSLIFDVLQTRLIPKETMDVHESVAFDFTDTGEKIFVTIRKGIAEVAYGKPMPTMPEPIARITTTSMTWKKLSSEQLSPVKALASGALAIDGDALGMQKFFSRFKKGF